MSHNESAMFALLANMSQREAFEFAVGRCVVITDFPSHDESNKRGCVVFIIS